jgi:hypothetical protein
MDETPTRSECGRFSGHSIAFMAPYSSILEGSDLNHVPKPNQCQGKEEISLNMTDVTESYYKEEPFRLHYSIQLVRLHLHRLLFLHWSQRRRRYRGQTLCPLLQSPSL